MKIHSIRLGHATNSSSSHSVITFPIGESPNIDEYSDFGWENFTATNQESKKAYLMIQLRNNLRKSFSDTIVNHIVSSVMDVSLEYANKGYIDHQSRWALPCEYGTEYTDIQFFKELKEMFSKDGFGFIGGNDNSDDFPFQDDWKDVKLPFPVDSNNPITCRKDGDIWTIYNSRTGAKIRFSFGDTETPFPSPDSEWYPTTPELVDMKITDYCEKGCDFCYQDSTKVGEHAEIGKIFSWIHELANAKVFELALGGGEPTSHPHFLEILRFAKNNGITPNFSTRTFKWLDDYDYTASVLELIGGFARTVTTVEEANLACKRIKEFSNKVSNKYVNVAYLLQEKMRFQIPMGTVTKNEFEKIIREAAIEQINITLLGYKTSGRGADHQRIDYPWWLDVVCKTVNEVCRWFPTTFLSIDTVLAAESKDMLNSTGVSPLTYRISDGFDSMYIDAVTGGVGRSSFEPNTMIYPTKEDNLKHVKETFRKVRNL